MLRNLSHKSIVNTISFKKNATIIDRWMLKQEYYKERDFIIIFPELLRYILVFFFSGCDDFEKYDN